MASVMIYRCSSCGELFNDDSDNVHNQWYLNSDNQWCHGCKTGQIGAKTLMSRDATVTSKGQPNILAKSDSCPMCGGVLEERPSLDTYTGHARFMSAICEVCGIWQDTQGAWSIADMCQFEEDEQDIEKNS